MKCFENRFECADIVFSSVPGFLSRSKRDKRKEKKRKKKEKEKDGDSEDKKPEVDEEGFSIRPDNPFDNAEDKNSWTSDSSDSDSGNILSDFPPIGT